MPSGSNYGIRDTEHKIEHKSGMNFAFKRFQRKVTKSTVTLIRASLVAQKVKNLLATQETWVQSLGWEDSLEEGMASPPTFLPRESPWTKKPGRLQSMGSHSDTTE